MSQATQSNPGMGTTAWYGSAQTMWSAVISSEVTGRASRAIR